MKKFAIVTLIGDNQGNRLQNYALQELLKEEKTQVETLNYYVLQENTATVKIKKMVKFVLSFFVQSYKIDRKRRDLFNEFNKSCITFSKNKICNEYIPDNVKNDYDYFICGSDQVWNTDYLQNGIVNFLGFVENGKKASYAASLGTKEIVVARTEEISEYINELDYISVREKSSIPVLKKLTNKEIRCDLDPTLLLDEEKWRTLEKNPGISVTEQKKFIVVYFLGSISNKIKEFIDENAKKCNAEIINIKSHMWYEKIGPREFLYLFDNATMIFTDSFHGTAFSLIFHKDFYSFHRDGIGTEMEDRITNILETAGISNRFLTNDYEVQEPIDYTAVQEKMREEKEKSIRYIKMLVKNAK
ncbi:MAG: polysaccharide pyruvyl transferase family protein [Ruminococcus sp.]|nr:polysaccharide pyruvyl transferase family protein [Ruminococcus sp.]